MLQLSITQKEYFKFTAKLWKKNYKSQQLPTSIVLKDFGMKCEYMKILYCPCSKDHNKESLEEVHLSFI